MASFDIVNEIDMQEMDNAVNNLKKEIERRYDFKGSTAEVELNKKDKKVEMTTTDDMKMQAMKEMFISCIIKRNIDPKSFEYAEVEKAGGTLLKRTVSIREGIDKDNGKKIVKLIKDSKLKVQASIMDDKVRVTAKKIDDLQAVIQLLKSTETELPLQFNNMKS